MNDHGTGGWFAYVDPQGVCTIRGQRTHVLGGDVVRAVKVLGYRLTGEPAFHPFGTDAGYADWPVEPDH